MTKKRIEELADFFYGSDDANKVPLRIMASTGQFGGFDFNRSGLVELLTILESSEDLKTDLLKFRSDYGG